MPERFGLRKTFFRSILSAGLAGLAAWLVFSALPIPLPALFLSIGAIGLGLVAGAVPIWQEIRLLINL